MTTQVLKPVETIAEPPFWQQRLEQIGFYSLILLAIMLPFELTQRPLIQLEPIVTFSNLEIVFYLCTALAAITLFIQGRKAWLAGQRRPGLKLGLFAALIIWCIISSLQGAFLKEGLKWTLGIFMGGIFALAIPYWFKNDPSRKLIRLCAVLVGAATISAGVGWLEFILGTGFADSLGWFKVQPTAAGPYLRLSGTFEYANIAAIYYEMMLPLAVVGLVVSLRPIIYRQFLENTPHPNPLPSRGEGTNETNLSRAEPFSTIVDWLKIALWLVAIVVLYEAILLTFSRAALLGTVAALATLVIAWRVVIGWRVVWTWAAAITAAIILIVTGATWVLQPVMGLRFTSQSDQDWYKAAYSSSPPPTMTICQVITTPVTVKNEGPLLWQANIKRPYYLGYHWLRPDETVFFFEGIRSPLPADISAGGSGVVQAQLKAPEKPGNYLLVWDMVQQDVSWFSLKIAQYKTIPVQILDLPPDEAKVACQLGPGEAEIREKPAPKVLPKVLAQPNRDQLWKAAIEMIKAKPILGVGPDNYRLVYGNYSNPKIVDWDTRIFANNTPLELAAGLGVIGAGLFGGLVVVWVWPVLIGLIVGFKGGSAQTKAIGMSQIILVGVLAALAAFAAHGVLDYFFGSRPIFYIMWLVLGLAALKPPKGEVPDRIKTSFNAKVKKVARETSDNTKE